MRVIFLAIAFTFSTFLFGQVKNDTVKKTEQLNDVVVHSSVILGSKFEIKNKTGSAYYISPQELQQFNYTDPNRILRSVPGVSITEEDGFGLRPNISLRGSSPERSAKITLMEDGVLIAPAPYSAPAAYYFPTIGRMQAVEVLKGSSQIQYGPYTTGGAINLISTAVPKEFSGTVRLAAGNYNSRSTEASIGDTFGQFGYVAQFFNYNSDGFKDLDGTNNENTGFDKSDYLAKLKWQTKKTETIQQSLEFKLQYSEEDSNETYLGLTRNDFETNPYRRYVASQADNMATEHVQYALTHQVKFSNRINLVTTGYLNNFKRNWYKLNDVLLGETVGIASVLDDPITFETEYNALLGNQDTPDNAFGVKANNREYYGAGVQSVANFTLDEQANHRLEVGLRYHEDEEDRFQWKDRYAIRNGEMIRTQVAERGTDANRISSAEAIAIHALYKFQWNKLTVTPGLRYENITLSRKDYGKEDTARLGTDLSTRDNEVDVWIPGIGLNYKLDNDISFFGGIHKGFAPPGSSEGQDPEESINIELGTRITLGAFNGELIGFRNDYENLLGSDLAATGGTGTLDQFNAGESLVQGVELLASYNVLHNSKSSLRLPIIFAYTFTDAVFQNDFESNEDFFGEVNDGDEIPYIARNQFNISAALEHEKFSINLSGRYNGEVRILAGSGDIPQDELIPDNFIVDLSARYNFTPKLTFNTTLLNMLDEEYIVSLRPAGLRPGAPFMASAGLQYTF